MQLPLQEEQLLDRPAGRLASTQGWKTAVTMGFDNRLQPLILLVCLQVVAELEQRSKQVAFDSSALTTQRQQLAALDAQRRAAMRAIDDSLAAAGARLDDRSKEEKLKQIRLVEEAYQVSCSQISESRSCHSKCTTPGNIKSHSK